MNKLPMNETISIHQQQKHFKYIRNLGDFMNSFNPKIKNAKISVNWVLI